MISDEELYQAVCNGEIIETYPDDIPYPSDNPAFRFGVFICYSENYKIVIILSDFLQKCRIFPEDSFHSDPNIILN